VSEVRETLREEIARAAVTAWLEETGLLTDLQAIADSHIPDQPAAADGNELVWAQRHVGKLRRMAMDAIAKATGGDHG
jgi:hypothetical protein